MGGLNSVPSSERVHIGFFGRRNAGKSSVVNAVTGQDTAVVSDKKGTTTDPVSKSMELLPLGPVVITDTPGFDDEGALGELRVARTKKTLNKTDIAVLVVDASEGQKECDRELISIFEEKNIPYITVYNKADLLNGAPEHGGNDVYTSAVTGGGIEELKNKLASLAPKDGGRRIAGDLVKCGDTVILVTPIDSAAPKGRLILPQQQTIRDLLDSGAVVSVVRETELTSALGALKEKPSLVITDSQVFKRVAAETPEDVPLTSFSILMARRKGFLAAAVKGALMIDRLKDGDKVLICEGCTHHRQCDDIGTVKLPRWLKERTKAELDITNTAGGGFPEDLSPYALVIHCGGCMLNEREVLYRMKCAEDAAVPFTNYGTAIAYMNGILERSIKPIPEIEI